MIVVSMVFVIVAAVTLLVGVFVGEENINYIYASIGACLGAFVFLVLGVLRGRPSRKPVLTDDDAPLDRDAAASETAPAPADSRAADEDDAAFRPPASADERVEFDDDDEDVEIVSYAQPDEDHEEVVEVAEQPAAVEEEEEDEVAYEYVEIGGDEDDDVEYEYVEIDEEGNEIPIDPPPRRAAAAPPAPEDRVADEPPTETAVGRAAPRGEDAAWAATSAAPGLPSSGGVLPERGAEPDDQSVREEREPTIRPGSDAGHPLSQAADAARDARRTEDVLLGVSGVGPAKRAVLLGHFGSFDRLMGASATDLSEVSGISPRLAERIREALDRAQP